MEAMKISSQCKKDWESLVKSLAYLKYIEVDANVVAGVISRLPMEEHASNVKNRDVHEKDLLLHMLYRMLVLGLSDPFVTETTVCFASTA